MTYILSSLASQLRSVITMSTGYAIALISTMLMYILLPIILTDLRGEARAGIAIMLMTACQVILFGPLAASFADRYGARHTLYGYALFFMAGAGLRLLSGIVTGIRVSIIITIMMLCFAAGYGCKMMEAYILRVSPRGNSGIAFSFLVTLAGLGRFIATLIQPYLVTQSYPWGARIMTGAMILFLLFLIISKDDSSLLHYTLSGTNNIDTKEMLSKASNIGSSMRKGFVAIYKHTFTHAPIFIRRCGYFPLVPLTIAFWEGIFYGTLWFIVPLYLAHHPEYLSHGWEIGIYEIISVIVAVLCGYLVDRRHTRRIIGSGWVMIIIAGIWMVLSPRIETMIFAGILIAVANNMLFSGGQHILAIHDCDHEDDGAYSQIRQLVLNIGYMFMPLLWGYMQIRGGEQFSILGIANIILALGSLIVACLLYHHHRSITQNIGSSMK